MRSDEDFADAVRLIVRSVREKKPNLTVNRVVAQEMHGEAVGEMLVGYRVDPQAGGMVLLAAGGVMTEIYRDRSIRVAPIDKASAYEMIDEIKVITIFKGFRGRPVGDMEALADALVAVSRIGLADMPPVSEFEINPLLVLPKGQGVRAVDILVRLAPDAHLRKMPIK